MFARIRRQDAAVTAASLVISLFLVDLLPGPAALLAVIIGLAGGLASWRRKPVGRKLLAVSAGLTLAILAIILLALAEA